MKTIINKIIFRIRAKKRFRYYKYLAEEVKRDSEVLSLAAQWVILNMIQKRLFELEHSDISLKLQGQILIYLKKVLDIMEDIAKELDKQKEKDKEEVQDEERGNN